MVTALLFFIAGIVLSNLQDFGVFKWESLLTMCAVYLGYYIIFINIVLFISAKAKKSGIALVLSLSVWILACLAAPKAASNLAESKHPFPTRQEFAANISKDKEEGLNGHDPWSEQSKLLEQKVLAEHGVDSVHQLPFNFDAYRMQKGEEHEAEIYFKHYNYLKEQYAQQSDVYQGLAAISPYLPTRFLSMAIAQTDYDTHWDFSDAAEDYRIATQKFLNNDFAQNSSYGDWAYQADPDLWKKLPAFDYQPPQLSSILRSNISSIWILAAWIFISFSILLLTTKTI